MNITTSELREKYLKFFEKKNHKRIPSASLIPENDPSVLFITAGMHPLVPYLMGEIHPSGKKLTNCQKCIRTGDIDSVGNAWHLTFFEMLGNWSLGDYFKESAIEYSFEFLTKVLNMPISKLSVTCFKGDDDAPRDEEAAKTWQKLGIPKNRIHFLSKEDNWWGPAGQTGPCGPDSEMFYHVKDIEEKSTVEFEKFNKDGVFCEIWNDVFMQYYKNKDKTFSELKQKNIDTGLGLERTVAVLNGFDNIYEVDTIKPIYKKVKEISKIKNPRKKEKKASESISSTDLSSERSARIITDHLRTATFILGDEIKTTPSNVDQGYVLRRLIRRSIRHARLIGINDYFCESVASVVIKTLKNIYPELEKNKEFIFSELKKEEEKFSIALAKGTSVLEKKLFYLEKANQKQLNAKGVFDLYQSYGFPLEMTLEICKEKGFSIDESGFNELLKKHQALSRVGAEKKFKGGLADNSEQTTKLHTATHLLNQALREVVNENIKQKGSNITAERLRFDFNSEERLTDEELKKIEEWVNKVVKENAKVEMKIMNIKDAIKLGAQSEFTHKYDDDVKVYTITDNKGNVLSREVCMGPHVKNTGEIGKFKITKQESVAAGVKRIKAVIE